MLGNRKQNLLKPTSLVQMHCSIVFRFCNVFKTRIFTIYDLCWKGFMLIFHLLLFVSLANSFWSDVVETPPFTAHVTDRVKLVSGGQTLGKCCWKYFGFSPPNYQLQNPTLMKVPSYLSSWILIQTHTDYISVDTAKPEERNCQDVHVEEHLLFSMNISASPGRDEAKLNCSSKKG